MHATVSRVRSHRRYFAKLRRQAYQFVLLQEEDRMRMAHDMHDGLGSLLSLISQQIYLGMRDGNTALLAEARENVQRVITELGYIVHDLAPHNLEEAGLETVLEEFFHRLGNAYPIVFDFEYRLIVPPPASAGIHLYRLVQEVVHNAVKHSGCSRISAGLKEDKEHVYIVCSDDGRGFYPEEAGGIGLKSLELRCSNLGGLMERRSLPGRGTTYLFTIPLQNLYGRH